MSRDYSKKKSNNTSNSGTKAGNRKRRRTERNRIRTIKYIHKLLDQIVEGVGTGFNHHGWCNAANALKQVSIFLEPYEYQAIGALWGPLYAANNRRGTNEDLDLIVTRIKERVAGDLLEML